jgi:hypothetical protein
MVEWPIFTDYFLARLHPTYTCTSSGWIGWIDNPRKSIFSRNLIFTNMYVVNSGWIGWFARIRFSQTSFFELCVLQTLLKWLNWHSLLTISIARLYPTHTCASSGWNGWIANPRKSNFSRNLISTNMYVVNNGWMVDSPKVDTRKLQFSNCVCCKNSLNGWMANLYWLFPREAPSNIYLHI